MGIALFVYYSSTLISLDKVTWHSNGNGLVLEESKYFWGGVWFNKDKVNISPQGFSIEKKSFILGKQNITIPYGKVKKVVFKRGYTVQELIVVSEGNFFQTKNSFYMTNLSNFHFVIDTIGAFCKNQFTTVEDESILYRLNNWTHSQDMKNRNRKEMILQFSNKEQEELSAKKGTVSASEAPLYDLPYVWLGKPISKPLPKECSALSGDKLTQVKQSWKNFGYDGFYGCNLKKAHNKWNDFLYSVLIYTDREVVKRVRWGLHYEDLSTLKKEYSILSYYLAKKYGLPTSENYEIEKGYEDNLEAYQNGKIKAYRIFQAKDVNIVIRISKENDVLIDYYFPKKEK